MSAALESAHFLLRLNKPAVVGSELVELGQVADVASDTAEFVETRAVEFETKVSVEQTMAVF